MDKVITSQKHNEEKMENRKLKMENFSRWIEGLLLTVVLCVCALRLTFIELPQNAMQNPYLWTTARGISLTLSSILFLTALIGLLLRIHKIRWQCSCWMAGVGLLLFAAATFLAIFPASDKRAAETECMTLIIPAFLGLIAFRWIDSARRMDVVLWVILSMGCAAVYTSVDQSMESNQQVVEDYRKDPIRQLKTLGIEPNSFSHFQYEHRLLSSDVRGFLTTSNSTGTFLLSGIFIAIGLLVDTVRSWKKDEGFAAKMIIQLLILLSLIFGLLVGKSRGAIGAAILAMALFALLIVCGRWLWKFRWAVLIIAVIAVAAVCTIAIRYGLEHGRLPGPNALFVRWQYWVSSAQMAADHPLLGVGGGNFATLYTKYKIPAAPETIKDPHNFILSLLCQFGPVAVIGFLLIIFAILWRGLKNTFDNSADLSTLQDKPTWFSQDKIIPLGVLVGVAVTLLYFRPIVSEGGIPGENTVVRQSVFIIMYLIPAFFFIGPFGFLWATTQQTSADCRRDGLILGLICGIIAILIHNLIDFAIFEPGVWTAFWLMLALLLAAVASRTPSEPQPANSGLRQWTIAAIIPAAIGIVFFIRVTIPIQAGCLIQNGLRNYEQIEQFITAAAKTDTLDPDPSFLGAQYYLNLFETQRRKQTKPLEQAIESLHQAQNRDPRNYRYDKLISEVFALKSEIDPNNQKEWLAAAYQSALKAQQFYLGSDQIAYDLGQLAEKLDQPQKAAHQYQKAVEIEDQYRIQFTQMYPALPLFSRLGQQRYTHAKDYLAKQSTPQTNEQDNQSLK